MEMITENACDIINAMRITNRRGDLPNVTKTEFADLVLQWMPIASGIPDRHTLVVEREDGRILTIRHLIFHANANHPTDLHEYHATLHTLNQRTDRCLRKWRMREAWVYPAPFNGEGYKTDPSGQWRYSVFR